MNCLGESLTDAHIMWDVIINGAELTVYRASSVDPLQSLGSEHECQRIWTWICSSLTVQASQSGKVQLYIINHMHKCT